MLCEQCCPRPEHRESAILLYNAGSVEQIKATKGGGDEKINSRKERKEDASQRVVPLDSLVLPVRERFPETSFPPSTQGLRVSVLAQYWKTLGTPFTPTLVLVVHLKLQVPSVHQSSHSL